MTSRLREWLEAAGALAEDAAFPAWKRLHGTSPAWYVWVLDSFDDAATWEACLARGPAPPAEWAHAIERSFSWLS